MLGISIYDDYGLSWDETTQRQIGLINLRYIFQGSRELFHPANENEMYYGPVVEIVLISLEKAFHLEDSQTIYLMRHLMTFLFFYAGLLGFYLLCKKRFGSWKIALIGSSLLLLSPRIFAHAFYNSKDLPLLSLFTLAIVTLINYLERNTWIRALLHAFCSALLIDLRLVGLLLPFLTFFCILGEIILGMRSKAERKTAIVTLLVYSLFLVGFIILFFPALWEAPVHHFLQALAKMKQYPWISTMLYRGEFVWSNQLPWHYLPIWFLITTPIIYTILFAVGVAYATIAFFKKSTKTTSTRHKHIDLLCMIWLFLPPFLAIISRAVLYDAWRHLFFIYPAFLIFTLHGLVRLFHGIISRFKGPISTIAKYTYILFIILTLSPPVYFMVKYHPYQHLYFNRLAGKDMQTVKQKFELDYWGLSYREALEYITQQDSRTQIKVYVAHEVGWLTAEILSPADRKKILYVDTPEQAEYFVSTYRWHKGSYPYENEWYSIHIGNTDIVVVYRL